MFIEYSLKLLLISSRRTTGRIYIVSIFDALLFHMSLEPQLMVRSGSGIIKSLSPDQKYIDSVAVLW